MAKSNMAEFQKWIKTKDSEISDWTEWLYCCAKKEGKTYNGAIRWLRKNKPDVPRSFNATASESFVGTIQAMFDDAIIKVRNEGLNKEVDDD